MLWDFRPNAETRYRPAWAWGCSAQTMRIQEFFRKSVVFVGVIDQAGAFAPYGTGFIVFYHFAERHFPYLVTARHVIEDAKSTKRPLAARVNTHSGIAQVGIIENAPWFHHATIPGCDIALTGFSGSPDTFDITGCDLSQVLLTPQYVEENDVSSGDEVFTLGLLTKHFGATKNIPITRIGNIAAMPDEPVDLGDAFGMQEVYLIESRSIGGLSGSPVFLATPPYRLTSKGHIASMAGHKRSYLMGVNVGLLETMAHADRVPFDAPRTA